jgi:hypothetical protein
MQASAGWSSFPRWKNSTSVAANNGRELPADCRALKKLNLVHTSVTDAGIRGLELIPTLEDLDLEACCSK